MKEILVMGGTRFSGKRLVSKLIEEGHDVTIATRGHNRFEFPSPIEQLTIERTDRDSIRDAIKGMTFDIVYDQICYSSADAWTRAKLSPAL
jgi:nucleoside-diphosphate-sugar epimerase